MLDRVQLKYEAKAITKNAAVSAYLFTLLYLAIGLVISGIDWLISGGPQAEVLSYAETYMPEFTIYLQPAEPILHLPALVAGFVSIVLSLVSAVLSAGYILYTMSVRRGIVTPYSTMSSASSCSCGRCCSSSPASSPATATASPCITSAKTRRWASWRR